MGMGFWLAQMDAEQRRPVPDGVPAFCGLCNRKAVAEGNYAKRNFHRGTCADAELAAEVIEAHFAERKSLL
jgi:hypothetical protein